VTERTDPGGEPEVLEGSLEEAREAIQAAERIVILTGAGISAESGVPTFRDRTGLWARYDPQELATPQGFARNPERVWKWYRLRREVVLGCAPNPGHEAVARVLLERPGVTLVTQNVDGLHRRALKAALSAFPASRSAPGPRPRILELHGNLLRDRCSRCAYHVLSEGVTESPPLPACPDCGALLRPDVVWFGEMLDTATLEEAFSRAREADICLVVGTSALVHPAASVPLATLEGGGIIIELNPQVTSLTRLAHIVLRGRSGALLPQLLGS
jgi:NAD-dependent deacetylase